jgi:thiamine biosynthesis lipoprotein
MSGPRATTRRELFARLRGQPANAERGHWLKVQRPAMACRFEVTLDEADARHVEDARAALDEIDAIEAALSWFRDTSELSRVNRAAAAGPVALGPYLLKVLVLSRELYAATGGAFDPASTALSRAWGFLARRPQLPSESALAEARAVSGLDKVVLDEAARRVRFAAPGVELSLGAIGKGFALDAIARSLRERGVGRALVSAGGSSQSGWGPLDWELSLEPGRRRLARVRLRNAALATSGAGEQYFEAAGRRFGHVLDPRTGWPAQGTRSASVVASEAAVADALSTAFLVAGPALAASVCAARPGTLALLVLDARPDELVALGGREGVELEPEAGVRVVRPAEENRTIHPD